MSHATVEQLMADLRAVIADVEGLIGATTGAAGERLSEARGRAQDTLRRVRERLNTFDSDLGEEARAALDQADEYVKQYPWAAVGIAAAVGVVLGLLLARR